MSELVAKTGSLLVWKASKAWKFLNGTINVYKPAEMATSAVIRAIKTNICRGKQTGNTLTILKLISSNYDNVQFATIDRFK